MRMREQKLSVKAQESGEKEIARRRATERHGDKEIEKKRLSPENWDSKRKSENAEHELSCTVQATECVFTLEGK